MRRKDRRVDRVWESVVVVPVVKIIHLRMHGQMLNDLRRPALDRSSGPKTQQPGDLVKRHFVVASVLQRRRLELDSRAAHRRDAPADLEDLEVLLIRPDVEDLGVRDLLGGLERSDEGIRGVGYVNKWPPLLAAEHGDDSLCVSASRHDVDYEIEPHPWREAIERRHPEARDD